MRDLEFWDTIQGIGDLYIENELVVATETVLFVCKDESEQRWIFMTYNSYDGIYVFAKVRTETLLKMLKDEITMEETFREAEFINETYIDDEDELCYRQERSDRFDEHRLPDKGANYGIHSKYICDYIKKLEFEANIMFIDYDYSPKHDLTIKIERFKVTDYNFMMLEYCNTMFGFVNESKRSVEKFEINDSIYCSNQNNICVSENEEFDNMAA